MRSVSLQAVASRLSTDSIQTLLDRVVSVALPVAGDGLILPNSSKERAPGLEKDLSRLELLGKEAHWSTLPLPCWGSSLEDGSVTQYRLNQLEFF